MLKGYILAIALTLIWIVLQIIVFHAFKPQKRFAVMTLLFIVTIPFYFIFDMATPENLYFLPASLSATPDFLGLANGFILYVLLYGTYVECFYYIDRPLTLRMLIEFLDAPGGTLTLAELQKRYSFREMIQTRLESMVANGYLVHGTRTFQLTSKGKAFATGFSAIRGILGVPYYLQTEAG